MAIQKRGASYRQTIDKKNNGKLDVLNKNSSNRNDFVPFLYAQEERNLQNQISETHTPPIEDSIDSLKLDTIATMESFEIKNTGRKLGVK